MKVSGPRPEPGSSENRSLAVRPTAVSPTPDSVAPMGPTREEKGRGNKRAARKTTWGQRRYANTHKLEMRVLQSLTNPRNQETSFTSEGAALQDRTSVGRCEIASWGLSRGGGGVGKGVLCVFLSPAWPGGGTARKYYGTAPLSQSARGGRGGHQDDGAPALWAPRSPRMSRCGAVRAQGA